MEKLKKNSMDGWLPWPLPQMGIWGPKATLQQLDACGGLAYCRGPRAVQLPCTPILTLLPPRSPGAAVFAGALIYAIHPEEILEKYPRGGSFGYCFALAWVAFPLALVSGIIYIHLRKRE